MFIRGKFFLFLFSASIVLYSCHSGSNKQEESRELPPLVSAPSFNADSAYHYVDRQVAFGPRIPNTSAHEKCAEWMIGKMKKFTDSVTVQRTLVKTQGNSYKCVNIIGHVNPASKERILLLAHWDTRAFADADEKTKDQHFDGADDGASGVGILLEAARQFGLKDPGLGVDILLTDVEDAGVDNVSDSWGLGTQYWARQAKKNGYRAKYGILLDMVGGKGAHFFREAVTRHYAGPQSEMVWNIANRIGYSDYFRYRNLGNIGITDDHEFINKIAQIPTMDIIGLQGNGDFMPWHHTIDDNMKVIDKNTLKAVGQTLLQVVYSNLSY